MIQIQANRVCRNARRISDDAPVDHRVKDIALTEKNGRVMKIGSMSGFSAGRVSSILAFIYHEDFDGEISLGHTVDMNISIGDSGAFLLNSKREIGGMIIDTVKGSVVVAGEEIVLSQGCFINMEDALRRTIKVLEEEVVIVPEPIPET